MTTPRKIRIFDTTLRDGEQAPGASMNETEKLEIARQLGKLGFAIVLGSRDKKRGLEAVETLKAEGIDHVAMEASSHGLDQERLSCVEVEAAAITNITRDQTRHVPGKFEGGSFGYDSRVTSGVCEPRYGFLSHMKSPV